MPSSSSNCLIESGILKTTIVFSFAAESWLSIGSELFSHSVLSSSKLLRVPESPSSTLELSESVRNLGSAPLNAPILCFVVLLVSFLYRLNCLEGIDIQSKPDILQYGASSISKFFLQKPVFLYVLKNKALCNIAVPGWIPALNDNILSALETKGMKIEILYLKVDEVFNWFLSFSIFLNLCFQNLYEYDNDNHKILQN